jgi:microcystin-dependent protein
MAKNKVSEWSSTASNNTDVGGIDIAEGCAPSGINNAIRTMMAEIKDFQSGASGDDFTCAGTLAVTGGFTLDGAAGTAGQVLVSAGSGNTPTWGTGIPSGVIVMWSGSIASIPSGWLLCNGTSGTPDLRNRFVIGAFQDNSGVANTTITGANTLTGGSKDSIVVSHTHTFSGTTSTAGSHTHNYRLGQSDTSGNNIENGSNVGAYLNNGDIQAAGDHTHTVSGTTDSSGASGTDANLVPYYALAFIMKA